MAHLDLVRFIKTTEEKILDNAHNQTYSKKGISFELSVQYIALTELRKIIDSGMDYFEALKAIHKKIQECVNDQQDYADNALDSTAVDLTLEYYRKAAQELFK